MNVYAESSAVLAWLLGDEGGDDVRERLSAAELVLTSELALIECDRVLHRAAALGELSEAEALARRTLFSTAAEHWAVFAIDGEMAERARRPFPREPLRTLDAIHVATALAIRSLVTGLHLMSLDERIRRRYIASPMLSALADRSSVNATPRPLSAANTSKLRQGVRNPIGSPVKGRTAYSGRN